MKLWKPEENFSKTFANPVIKKKEKIKLQKKSYLPRARGKSDGKNNKTININEISFNPWKSVPSCIFENFLDRCIYI